MMPNSDARKRAEEAADYPKAGWHGEVLHAAPESDGAGDVEALAEVLAPELYVALMEVTADSWRQWHYLTPEAREKHRAHAAQIVANGLSDWLAADRAAAERRGAEKALREAADALDDHTNCKCEPGDHLTHLASTRWIRARADQIGGTR